MLVFVVVANPKPRDHARLIHHSERSGIEIDADAPDPPVRIVWIERWRPQVLFQKIVPSPARDPEFEGGAY
jgi:hypothetical protein